MTRPFPIEVFESLSSTNDSILAAGSGDAPEGTTHLALVQTRGRGRGDHTWWSPRGAGLWMSTLLRPPSSSAHWGGISLLAGKAVKSAVEKLGVKDIDLYWPNDLQVGRRKLGGILGEVRSRGQRAWVALGIGLNIDLTSPQVRRSMPAELTGLAICLEEAGPPRTRDPVEIAQVILNELWPLYERFTGGTAVTELVGSALAHAGRTVEIQIPGESRWRGRVSGLTAEGALLVLPEGRERAVPILGGEVIYVAEP